MRASMRSGLTIAGHPIWIELQRCEDLALALEAQAAAGMRDMGNGVFSGGRGKKRRLPIPPVFEDGFARPPTE
jgi:hypothetical protein